MSQRVIQKTISMPAHPKFFNEVRGLLKETLTETPFSDRDRSLIVLAIDEAIGSIVGYSKETGICSEIYLTIDVDDVRLKVTISDTFTSFDLNGGLTDHELADRIDDARKHKLGIFLMRSILDEISYTYKKGFENELTLIKFV